MFKLSSTDTDFSIMDQSIAPNRQHMSQPFEFLQITIGVDSDNLHMTTYQAGISGTFYTSVQPGDFDKIIVRPDPDKLLHTHDYYELLFVRSGEIYQNIDSFRHYYSEGSACLVSPHTMHTEEYSFSADARLFFLKFRPDYIEQLFSSTQYFHEDEKFPFKRCCTFLNNNSKYMDFIPKNEELRTKDKVRLHLNEIGIELGSPGNASTMKISLKIYELLQLLFDQDYFDNTPIPAGNKTEQLHFQEIKEYIEKSPTKITRADLEKHLHYSGDYIYKIIKKQSGLSIYDFSMQLCMKKAARLLETSSMHINEVAEAVGFHNYTQFYQLFKKHYGMTPRQYRTHTVLHL